MTDSPNSPTSEQVWEAAFDALQSGDEARAQDCFLHWALLLDENAQAAWLKEIPDELHNTIGSIFQTADTISANSNDSAHAWERLVNRRSTGLGARLFHPGNTSRIRKRRCSLSSRGLLFRDGHHRRGTGVFHPRNETGPRARR